MKYGNVTLGRVEAVWNKLGGEEGVKRFLSGLTEVVPMERIINCNEDPFLMSHWKVAKHDHLGKLVWDASKVKLEYSSHKEGEGVSGNTLYGELSGKVLLNANVLEFLLENEHLIPDEWRRLKVYFWGTLYCLKDEPSETFVLYLCTVGEGWCRGTKRLTETWESSWPTAVLN